MKNSDFDFSYNSLIERILREGVKVKDRTGVGTLEIFGHQIEYTSTLGSFPMITSKQVNFKAIAHEIIWFLRGDTNTKYLKENGVNIWDHWADEYGNVGPIYGAQWRNWNGHSLNWSGASIDQIRALINELKNNPYSRRAVVSAWNAGELDRMCLPPCPVMFQVNLTDREDGKYNLNMHLYQRSADVFVGLPFDFAGYFLLMHILSNHLNAVPNKLVWSCGSAHLYLNHIDAAKLLLSRRVYREPNLWLSPKATVDNINYNHIYLRDYISGDPIKVKVAI